jgi:hypothetical protein
MYRLLFHAQILSRANICPNFPVAVASRRCPIRLPNGFPHAHHVVILNASDKDA